MNETRKTFRYTPNQLVAYNLRRARELRGWTQDQAAKAIEPHLGERWSSASYSLAERSTDRPDRIRNFTADEIVAFCLAFELPLAWFLFPPDPDPHGRLPVIAPSGVKEGREPLTGLLIELVFANDEGQALLAKRLHDLLAAYPEEMEGPFMKYLSEATEQASLRAIEQATGELDTWVTKLRELAVYLESARESTLPTVRSGLRRHVGYLYGELVADDESRDGQG